MTEPKISIQVLSDLHLEINRPETRGENLYDYEFAVKAEILALLGDIGLSRDRELFEWLRAQLARFEVVFYVVGNHEPYISNLDESRDRFLKFSAEVEAERASTKGPNGKALGQFVFLNRNRYDLSSTVTVLGCTLWSRLNPDDVDIIHLSLVDFRAIGGLDPEKFQALHRKDLDWLNESVQDIEKKEPHREIIILTHHAPTMEGTSDPRFEAGPLSSAFATELVKEPCWGRRVKVWAFGHTHWNCDFVKEGVRVYSNQRGYKEGEPGYHSSKVLEF
ncbi:hypothetical protein AN958_06175 [Leucoagaricus sp. SymC.cos]|nr:hypothetical protein AN958_06175 [Leucoagaricus sp. SymC.cos]